jgi:hypothetical protein
MSQVGYSLSLFGAMHAHNAEKKTLGLPRLVKTTEPRRFLPSRDVADRHASPWHIHVSAHSEGLEVRYIAFPSPWLGPLALSIEWLNKLGDHLMADLTRRAKEQTAIQSDFGTLAGAGTAVRTAPAPKAFVYTQKKLGGIEKLRAEFPPTSFTKGQKNYSKGRIQEFLDLVEQVSSEDRQAIFAAVTKEFGLSDKETRKKKRKDETLAPLIDRIHPPGGGAQ